MFNLLPPFPLFYDVYPTYLPIPPLMTGNRLVIRKVRGVGGEGRGLARVETRGLGFELASSKECFFVYLM